MSATIDAAIAAGFSVSVEPRAQGYVVFVGRGSTNAMRSGMSASIAIASDIDATVNLLRDSMESQTPPLPSQDELDAEAQEIESSLRLKYPGAANVQVVIRRSNN